MQWLRTSMVLCNDWIWVTCPQLKVKIWINLLIVWSCTNDRILKYLPHKLLMVVSRIGMVGMDSDCSIDGSSALLARLSKAFANILLCLLQSWSLADLLNIRLSSYWWYYRGLSLMKRVRDFSFSFRKRLGRFNRHLVGCYREALTSDGVLQFKLILWSYFQECGRPKSRFNLNFCLDGFLPESDFFSVNLSSI